MKPILEYLANANFNNARIIQKSSFGNHSLSDHLMEVYSNSNDLQKNWLMYFFKLESTVKDYRHYIITHVNKAWEAYFQASGLTDQYNLALSQSTSLKDCNNILSDIFINATRSDKFNQSKTLCFIADMTDDLPIRLLKDVANEILIQSELLRVKKFIILKDEHVAKHGRNTKQMLSEFFPDIVISDMFEVQHEESKSDVIKIYHYIELELIQHIKKNPSVLCTLSSRQFEELIASIFKNQGFDVELTPKTRDGGIDIIAVQNSLYTGNSVHLIECKRYAPHNSVGIAIVQRLLGAVTQHQAHKGIVVTTSFFTNDAKSVAADSKKLLSLYDYNNIITWLDQLKL